MTEFLWAVVGKTVAVVSVVFVVVSGVVGFFCSMNNRDDVNDLLCRLKGLDERVKELEER